MDVFLRVISHSAGDTEFLAESDEVGPGYNMFLVLGQVLLTLGVEETFGTEGYGLLTTGVEADVGDGEEGMLGTGQRGLAIIW